MPSVMSRFNVPPTEEWDPSLLPEINFGFAESHKGGDVVLRKNFEGSFGLISGQDLTDEIDRETVNRIAPLVERQINNEQFDPKNPIVSMQNIFLMAQEEVKDAARLAGPDFKTRIDMSLVKIFVDPSDRQLKAVYGQNGRHALSHVPDGKQPRNLSSGLTDAEINAGIGIPPTASDSAKFGVLNLDENDRIILQSRNAAGYDQTEAYSKDELLNALRNEDPTETADLLIQKNDSYENRSALVIVAPAMANSEVSQRRRGGPLSSAGYKALGGIMTSGMILSRRPKNQSRFSAWRNRNRNDGAEAVVAEDNQPATVAGAGDDIRNDRVVDDTIITTDTGRRVVTDEHETRRQGRGSKALKYGILAVGSFVALRYFVDLGDEVSSWIGDQPDTGIDINTWGDGDLDDGNRQGWDFNVTNETLEWNDDPINESFRDTGGIDIAPSFLDGDWFSLNGGDIDLPSNEGEPNVDLDRDGDTNPPQPTEGTPDIDLNAPEVSPPEVEPVTPPPPAPPAWVPDAFTIESGSGLTQEIHEMGHQVAGFENFTNDDSTRIMEQARERFGDNLLNLPNHSGNDLYRVGDELRISAPGQAQWANQAIEQFMFEEMEKLAKAKK